MVERSERWGKALTGAVCGAAFLSPWLIVVAMASGPLNLDILPDIAKPTAAAQEAPPIVAGLIQQLIGMAVGVMVVAWLLFRRPVRQSAEDLHRLFPLIVSATAVASIYAGMRCQFEIAIVISRSELDVAALSPFLGWQSGLFLVELSTMAAGGVHYFLNRDRRTEL